MDYIEDDFTDALIDAICEKSPRKTGTPWWERTLTQMKKQ